MTPLKTIKQGEYFKRTETANTIYVKGHYDKQSKSFCCTSVDDISKEIFIKADKLVFLDFEY